MDPNEVARLGQETLNAASWLSHARLVAQDALALPPSVFGNLPAAARLHAAHQDAADSADAAVEVLALVYEDDADGLFQCAANYLALDLSGPR